MEWLEWVSHRRKEEKKPKESGTIALDRKVQYSTVQYSTVEQSRWSNRNTYLSRKRNT